MELFRRYFFVIVLTAIIVIVWGGIQIFSDKRNSTINENAQMYTKPLDPTFDGEIIKTVSDRASSSFPVSPSSFFELNNN